MQIRILLTGLLAMTLTMSCGKDDNNPNASPNNQSDMRSSADLAGTEDTGSADAALGADLGSPDVGAADVGATPDMAPDGDFLALIIGTLASVDLAEAQMTHDAVAAGGEAGAKMAGDFAHKVMLGTTLLGTTENEFLGIDRWTSVDGALAVYGDPDFQMAFGSIFAPPPPMPMLFEHRPDWYEWGDFNVADASDPHFFVVVRGRLAEADPAAAQAAHDAVAMGGEGAATALGDVGHIVFVGVEDPQEFLAIDIWSDDTNMTALYTNPDFTAAFATLFEAPPTLAVYRSTDWYQW